MFDTPVWRVARGLTMAATLAWASVASGQQPVRDVTGHWSLAIRTPDGPESRALDLVMAKDGSVTGSVTAPAGTLELSRGVLSRDSLQIEFAMAGGQIRVTFEGIVKGDTLRGVYRQEGYVGDLLGVRGDRTVRLPNGRLTSLERRSESRNCGFHSKTWTGLAG